jgi:hypothetical protein
VPVTIESLKGGEMERDLSNLKRGKPVTKIMFLITGILVLGIGFVFVSCGTSPQEKTLTDKGDFAIDFSRVPAGNLGVIPVANPTEPFPSLREKEFTIEAWVKRNTPPLTNLSGGILTGYEETGTAMWVKDNIPKFTIRRDALRALGPPPFSTSTDYTVDSGFTLNNGEWTHIAGVLVDDDHSAVIGHPTCPDGQTPPNPTGGEAEGPHLDIYVNGELENCATTWGDPEIQGTGPQFLDDDGKEVMEIGRLTSGGPQLDGLDKTVRFNGVIDDVRFWTVARTQAQIQQCRNQKLEVTGPCAIDPSILKAYWPLQEGEGTRIRDIAGFGGYGGSIGQGNPESATVILVDPDNQWDGGWVAGDWPQ